MSEERLKRAELALRESEDKFKYVFDYSPVGKSITNPSGAISTNTAFCDILGYSQEELNQKKWQDITHPDDIGMTNKMMDSLLSGERESVRFAKRFIHKNGSVVWVDLSSILRRDKNGKALCLISTLLDITERKRSELALRESEEKFATIFKEGAGSMGLYSFPDGKTLEVNDNFELITGYSREEALGKTTQELGMYVDENARARFYALAREKGIVRNFEVDLKHKSGAILKGIMSSHVINVRDAKYMIATFYDITEMEKMKEAVQRMDKLESLGVLAGGIAHDFNNLLSGIFGYIDLARESRSGDASVVEHLDKAFGVLNRAKALTQQLLTFSRGGAPVRKTAYLGPLIEQSVKFALSGSKITGEFFLASDLHACDIDENQVGQVIDNIIINAQQAMPMGGRMTVTANNLVLNDGEHPPLIAGRYVQIAIKDTGTGIQPKLLKRIFDPFFTTKQKGTGLGLATCYSIMRKHEGCIEVESELDKGSAFSLFFPASTKEAVSERSQPISRHKGRGTVLVMDDEDFIRELTREMFKDMGYGVLAAKNGEEALKLVADVLNSGEPLVCALLDLTVPGGMGGKETIARFRKQYPNVPVFASSGYSEDPVIANPKEYGFTDSLRKPFLKTELAELLNKHVHAA
jgi:PAS domain S-box-containing protein